MACDLERGTSRRGSWRNIWSSSWETPHVPYFQDTRAPKLPRKASHHTCRTSHCAPPFLRSFLNGKKKWASELSHYVLKKKRTNYWDHVIICELQLHNNARRHNGCFHEVITPLSKLDKSSRFYQSWQQKGNADKLQSPVSIAAFRSCWHNSENRCIHQVNFELLPSNVESCSFLVPLSRTKKTPLQSK